MLREQSLLAVRDWLKERKQSAGTENLIICVQKEREALSEQLTNKKAQGRLSKIQQEEYKEKLHIFLRFEELLKQQPDKNGEDFGGQFSVLREDFGRQVTDMKAQAEAGVVRLDQTLSFLFDAFGNGTEMLLVLSDLTEDAMSSRFIGRYGSEKYALYSKELMVRERQDQILEQLMEEA